MFREHNNTTLYFRFRLFREGGGGGGGGAVGGGWVGACSSASSRDLSSWVMFKKKKTLRNTRNCVR